MDASGPVLFFDGECGLCERCVRTLIALDRKRRLRFAPLQGGTAQAFLRECGWSTTDFDSAIFVSDWSRRADVAPAFKTDALLAALISLGGVWRATAMFRLVPRSWRDAFYSWVARRRLRFFGPAKHSGWASRKAGRFLP